jgi:hypothetical protein
VVARKQRRKTAPYTEPLAHADGCNRVWCADFKGWFRTLREIQATQGDEALAERYKQQQHNRQRRQIRTDRKRYAAIALERNLRLAAERLAERKLAAARAEQNVEPPTSATTKKPPTSIDKCSLEAAPELQKEANSIA